MLALLIVLIAAALLAFGISVLLIDRDFGRLPPEYRNDDMRVSHDRIVRQARAAMDQSRVAARLRPKGDA